MSVKLSKTTLPAAIMFVAILFTAVVGVVYYEKQKTAQGPSLTPQTTPPTSLKSIPDAQQSEIDALKRQVESLQQRPSPTVVKEVPQETPKNNDADYSAIVSEWQDRVAKVICDWTYLDGTIGKTGQASGLLWNYSGVGTALITNKHVVSDENGVGAFRCLVGIYGKGSRLISHTGFLVGNNQDFAVIKLGSEFSLPDNPNNSDFGYFDKTASQHGKVCTSQVNIGDKLIVLGYPAIGAQGGITATEGIISGFEGDYYVTSAKIDHGNSGGAAILIKDDCYLGIPTWVAHIQNGFESLGRILKSSFVFGKQ